MKGFSGSIARTFGVLNLVFWGAWLLFSTFDLLDRIGNGRPVSDAFSWWVVYATGCYGGYYLAFKWRQADMQQTRSRNAFDDACNEAIGRLAEGEPISAHKQAGIEEIKSETSPQEIKKYSRVALAGIVVGGVGMSFLMVGIFFFFAAPKLAAKLLLTGIAFFVVGVLLYT